MQKRALSIIWPGISYETALDKAALSTLSDRRAVSCIKFIGKVRPGNPLYPLIHNRVVPISTSVCLRSGSLVGQWPQGLNVSQILLVLNINLVNQCSVLAYISQLVRYPTIQSSDYKRDNPATSDLIWFDLIYTSQKRRKITARCLKNTFNIWLLWTEKNHKGRDSLWLRYTVSVYGDVDGDGEIRRTRSRNKGR